MIEDILRDVYAADHSMNIALLRYFNPIGAHKSGRIGEDPNGIPTTSCPMSRRSPSASSKSCTSSATTIPPATARACVTTSTSSTLLARTLSPSKNSPKSPVSSPTNIGTGNGYSVLEIVRAFEKASGKKVPYVIDGRRPGDIAECYADPTLAEKEMGFKCRYGLDEMCEDSWRWQRENPNGF